MKLGVILFLTSGLIFVSSMHATDISMMDEIKNCDGQIQKVNEQLRLEESKPVSNSRNIKYLTDKKSKLMANKLKKMIDLKNNLQKYSNDLKVKIEKLSAKKKTQDNDKIVEKMQDTQKKYEDEIKRLAENIDLCEAEIKKTVDHKEKNKTETDKKKCGSLFEKQGIRINEFIKT